MARLLIMGSLDFSQVASCDMATWLGREIIDQGHDLLTGCRNELDRRVAEAAYQRLQEKGGESKPRIVSYAAKDCAPAHSYGTVLKSRWGDWNNLALANLFVPETIHEADALIIVGGTDGTMCAANWGRIAHKRLFPLTAFGGSAVEIYERELQTFNESGNVYADRIERREYEVLNQLSSNLQKIAHDAIALAARALSSREVFVIMSFSSDPRLEDAFDTFTRVCADVGYDCHRVDENSNVERIVPEIFTRIRRAGFIIADLTEAKPNVYYELGFAQGVQKKVVVTALRSTALPFDVADIPVLFWESQKQLRERLTERIKTIAESHGR